MCYSSRQHLVCVLSLIACCCVAYACVLLSHDVYCVISCYCRWLCIVCCCVVMCHVCCLYGVFGFAVFIIVAAIPAVSLSLSQLIIAIS